MELANRGEGVADGRALDPIGMRLGVARTRGPDTPPTPPTRGRGEAGGRARHAQGLEEASQSEHDSGGRAGSPANWKQGLRKASREEAGGGAGLEVANHRSLTRAGGPAALLGTLGVSVGACEGVFQG